MNKVIVTLLTNTQNELNRFLSTYFSKDMNIDDNAFKWSCIYSNPLESINLISTAIDNIEDYNMLVTINIDHKYNIKVSQENLDTLIKFMYFRYGNVIS